VAAGWHLDSITLRSASNGHEYFFECKQWLATTEADKEVVRELPATGQSVKKPGKLIPYKVRVFTSDVRGAGTDANVYVNINGALGDTGDRHLHHSDSHHNKFERKKEDTFTINAVDLGEKRSKG
jgi:hypothetical protein